MAASVDSRAGALVVGVIGLLELEDPAPDLAPDEVARVRADDWHSPRATNRPAARAIRTNSAMSRDFPIPASAAIPTIPVTRDGLLEGGLRDSASSARRPTSSSS